MQPEQACVFALCAAHVLLWGRVVSRNSGGKRALLAALLAWHTGLWAGAVRKARAPLGYDAVCGRTVSWDAFRVTREALGDGEVWASPAFGAFGELWRFKACLNRSVAGAPHVSAYLARQHVTGAPPPPPVEFSLRLGEAASEPAVYAFDEWPYNAGQHAFVSHERALDMLEGRPHLTLSARLVNLRACTHFTQLLFAGAEAAVLALLVLAGEPREPRRARRI
jgi:hypothetical protein